MARLAKHVDHARRLHRARILHEALETEAVEQLHHVVEVALLGDAEIVDVDGV